MTSKQIKSIASPMGTPYLETAFLFAEQAKLLEDRPLANAFQQRVLHGSLVRSSIIASASALESSINEWFSFPALSKKPKAAKKLICELWELGIPRTAAYPILQKYQIALMLSGKEPFAEGCEPYQSVRALVELRNWLVHYEPTHEPVYSDTGEPPEEKAHKLYGRLKDKFPLNPLCAEFAPFWPFKCLGAGCAKLKRLESLQGNMHFYFHRPNPAVQWTLKPPFPGLPPAALGTKPPLKPPPSPAPA